ncbi:MAG: universal stress protein [Halobacteriaceae archaeon]
MKVLVGVDESENAVRALDWALDRAAAAGDEVAVVVVEDGEEAIEEEVRERIASVNREVDVRTVGAAEAGSTLVGIAEREAFDEVVLGGGERSPMGKIRLGDMREFVILNADVTVTLVR